MVKVLGLILLVSISALAQNPPAEIKRFSINISHINRTAGGLRREPTKLRAEIFNLTTDRGVIKVEFQFDVIDALRRVVKERLFIKIDDPGFGDRSIKPGKSMPWYAELGELNLPDGCATYNTVFSDSHCIANLKINVVHFKDGGRWEREGWRNEPNPNKP